MPTPYDDPMRSVEREMRRAERERRQTVVFALLGGTIVVAIAAIVAAVTFGRAAADERAATPNAREVAASDRAEPTESAKDPAPAVSETETAEAPAEPKPAPKAAPKPVAKPKPAVQKLSVGLGQYGYDPEVLTAKAGIPIKLTVAEGQGCAAGFLMPSLNVNADNTSGPAVIDLPALDAGSYQFTCGMEMVAGTLEVR